MPPVEAIGRLAVIAAMDEELAVLRNQLVDEVCLEISGFEYFVGDLRGVPVLLSKCGIGKVNGAMGTTILCQAFSPIAVINTGSAGAFDGRCEIGEIILASAVCYHDVDVTVFGYQFGQVPHQPPRYEADVQLFATGKVAAAKVAGVRVHTGMIVSGDSFMDSAERVALVQQRFPDAIAAEMEAAAIAQVCLHFGVPALIVRAISDVAGIESRVTHEEFLAQASIHSAGLVTEIVTLYSEQSMST